MDIDDYHTLMLIKNKLGGSVKSRSGSNSYRYRLHHQKGMIDLVNRINGNIRNSKRVPQLMRVCSVLGIPYISATTLQVPLGRVTDNAWFSGFFDSCGTITASLDFSSPPALQAGGALQRSWRVTPPAPPALASSPPSGGLSQGAGGASSPPSGGLSQGHETKPFPLITITLANKHKMDVEPFLIFHGSIHYSKSGSGRYVWSIQSESDINNMLEYFKIHPLRSHKVAIINQVIKFYTLRSMPPSSPSLELGLEVA
jgi:hypothetical protein